jgi:hypothetical protein
MGLYASMAQPVHVSVVDALLNPLEEDKVRREELTLLEALDELETRDSTDEV